MSNSQKPVAVGSVALSKELDTGVNHILGGFVVEGTPPQQTVSGWGPLTVDDILDSIQILDKENHEVSHVFSLPFQTHSPDKAARKMVRDIGHIIYPSTSLRMTDDWFARAVRQGDSDERESNAQKAVLCLFDWDGGISATWREAGYQVYSFGMEDVLKFSPDYFSDEYNYFDGAEIYAILSGPPFPVQSISETDISKDAAKAVLGSILATVELLKPIVWAIENPIGSNFITWSERNAVTVPMRTVGEPYDRVSVFVGRFSAGIPVSPVRVVTGRKNDMAKHYAGLKFWRSFFVGNSAAGHPGMALAWKYDRLPAGLVTTAIEKGHSPDDINYLIEDHYFVEMNDDACIEALKNLT